MGSINETIDKLYEEVRADTFKKSFPVILTDKGSGFKSPELIESNNNGDEITKVF